MKLQILRRCVQVTVILVVATVAMLSLYAHYRSARVVDDPQLMAGLRGEVISQAIHPYVDSLDDPQRFLDANKGTLWSMRLLGVSVTDPLAAVEMTAAAKRVHWPLVLSILIPVAVTLILGRVFCSWICPAYLLFELTGKLRKLLRLAEIRPGEVCFSHNNKYLLLIVGLMLTAVVSTPIFALIYPPAVISRAIHAWIFGTAATAMLVILGLIVLFELFVSPRWWCRTMCPGGALYALLGWARPVRVKLKREACTGCLKCIPVCEAGINPITQSSSIECDNCGVCLRHCGDGALVFTVGLPDGLRHDTRAPRGIKPAARGAAQSPSKAIVLVIVGLGSLLHAAPAFAHHILGLPHYSYKENYPQRPTLEYPATTGPYDVLLTSYPGVPNPGEPANLAFYVKNRETSAAYAKPITVRVLQTSTFGDNTVVLEPTTRSSIDNEYKYHVTFPVDGEYVVELSMPVEGRVEVIPFLMIVGEPSATASIIVLSAFGLVLTLVIVRAVQRKRLRRNNTDSQAHGVGHGVVPELVELKVPK